MKAKSLIGFKVCDFSGGKYSSIVTRPEIGGVEYRIGKRVVPQKGCGPLTIFKTVKEAVGFNRDRIHGRLLLCRYQPSRGRYIWRLRTNKKWRNAFTEVCQNNLIDPNNAALARNITPIREIPR